MDASSILAALPAGLREPLVQSYQQIAKNYVEHRWEPAELNGGKFCECVYSIIHGNLVGPSYPTRPSKPRDMVTACRALESVPPDTARAGDRSLRILIPRMLLPLYEIRNNRGVGHVGGDVDPNFLDATSVYAMASWVLAELVRIFHGVSIAEAQAAVDMLVERKHPLIWLVGDKKRVLDPRMDKGTQTLLLLLSEPSWVNERELMSWVEYSSLPMFKSRILKRFHKSRLIEYEEPEGRVRISPLGINHIEKQLTS